MRIGRGKLGDIGIAARRNDKSRSELDDRRLRRRSVAGGGGDLFFLQGGAEGAATSTAKSPGR